jgi:hypothetical protein
VGVIEEMALLELSTKRIDAGANVTLGFSPEGVVPLTPEAAAVNCAVCDQVFWNRTVNEFWLAVVVTVAIPSSAVPFASVPDPLTSIVVQSPLLPVAVPLVRVAVRVITVPEGIATAVLLASWPVTVMSTVSQLATPLALAEREK